MPLSVTAPDDEVREDFLRAYVTTYLSEEVKAGALVSVRRHALQEGLGPRPAPHLGPSGEPEVEEAEGQHAVGHIEPAPRRKEPDRFSPTGSGLSVIPRSLRQPSALSDIDRTQARLPGAALKYPIAPTASPLGLVVSAVGQGNIPRAIHAFVRGSEARDRKWLREQIEGPPYDDQAGAG